MINRRIYNGSQLNKEKFQAEFLELKKNLLVKRNLLKDLVLIDEIENIRKFLQEC